MTAVYGGSFDPPHEGHRAIVANLVKRFARVVVVPGGVTPFKVGRPCTDTALRLAMLRPMTVGQGAELDMSEISRGGVNYSADTLRRLKSESLAELYFVLGGEELYRLREWKDAEWLKANVKFYAVPRPGFDARLALSARRRDGFDIAEADFEGPDISSSEVRAAVAFDNIKGLVPDYVGQIIRDNNLYADYRRYTEAFPRFRLSPQRIAHTYRAVLQGIKLAKIYRADLDETITALVLHDIGKDLNRAELAAMGIETDEDIDNVPVSVRHAYYGKAIARQYFGIENERILAAIENHTTGSPAMDTLSKITALADYTEAGRNFEGAVSVRELSMTDIDAAVGEMLGQVICFLRAEGKEIYFKTLEAYEYYKKDNNDGYQKNQY